MASSKKAFGQFVTGKRLAAGLTQSSLAERLFVTESAVSKWERGVSYPDISLVAPLAQQLGVSEGELIKASDDVVAARVGREARFYRRWRAGLLWTTATTYSIALATCFVVNLVVDHSLSWFWVVLTAIAVAFTLTTLPLLVMHRRALTVVGAFLVSLFATFTVAWVANSGGAWLPIAIAAVLLTVVMVLGPVALWKAPPPMLSRHLLVFALGLDTVALIAFLFVVAIASDRLDLWWSRTLPIAAMAMAFPWVVALVIAYLPVSRLARAAIVVGFAGVFVGAFRWVVGHITNETVRPVNLSRWRDPYIDGNVSLLALGACLAIAVILGVAAALKESRRADSTADEPSRERPREIAS